MRNRKGSLLLMVGGIAVLCLAAIAEDKPSPGAMSKSDTVPASSTSQTNSTVPATFDQVVDRIVERERAFNEQMRTLQPLVETYIQSLTPDHELGLVPSGDHYFLGRLNLQNGVEDHSYLEPPKGPHGFFSKLTKPIVPRFLPRGFAQMAILDNDFERSKYDFTFVRREFLGEVRCLVVDVQPRKNSGNGRFIGRIWVED